MKDETKLGQTRMAYNDLMINFGQLDYRKAQFKIDLRILIRSVIADLQNAQAKASADMIDEMNEEPFK
jgi:hypothetical protein